MDVWQIEKTDSGLAKTKEEKIKFLLNYAILAPSTHNTQPWKFKINEDVCEVILDESKKLPIGDPLTRDLYISIGCCVENLVAAAESFGVNATAEINTNLRAICSVKFGNLSSSLMIKDQDTLDSISNRLNARGIFKEKKVDREFINKIKLQTNSVVEVEIVEDRKSISDIADLTAKGLEMAYADPAFRNEISSWIRPNFSKKRDGIPGYSLRLGVGMSMIMPYLMKHFNIGKKLGALNKASLNSAPLVCVLSTDEQNAKAWIEVGRVAERIMLDFNKFGMRTSIFVASVEMGDLVLSLKQVVGTLKKPQFVFCGGFIDTPQGHTKRHVLSEMLVKS